jgi:putative PIN family toxin of toxin-antitoxin system
MARRRARMRVVLDTNVFVRNFKAKSNASPNRRIVRLWLLERRLQLVVSPEMIGEYLEIFADVLGMDNALVKGWKQRFEKDGRTTVVNLARRFTQSRDPDDNLVLATALSGRADNLITNDRDLLELPARFLRTLPFAVVTPQTFLAEFEP